MHPAYQRIIALGRDVVPLLLRDLQVEPKYWFWALSSITGEQPVADDDAGDMERMTEAWLQWGRQHHFL